MSDPVDSAGATRCVLAGVRSSLPRAAEFRRPRRSVGRGAALGALILGALLGSAAPLAAPLPVPIIEPFPAQIVSAGYVVRLKIRAHLDDGRPPQLMVDRLPTHASFDENPDGSRTLYWPTGEGDRGEYRLRITALHPEDGTRASSVDALIIVDAVSRGDSRSGLPFVSGTAVTERGLSTVAADVVETAGHAGVVDSEVLEPHDLPGSGSHDPYSTYDDHPAYDPYADVDDTYDPQDSHVDSSDDYFMAIASELPLPDETLDEIRPDERGDDYFDDDVEKELESFSRR